MPSEMDIISDYPSDLNPVTDLYWQSNCNRVQCNAVMLKYGIGADVELLVSHAAHEGIEVSLEAHVNCGVSGDENLARATVPHTNVSATLTSFKLHSYVLKSTCPKMVQEIENKEKATKSSGEEEGGRVIGERENRAHIENVCPVLVAELLRYIYTKEAHVNGERALRLVPLAIRYNLQGFVRLLYKFLNKTTTAQSVSARLNHIQKLSAEERPSFENACLEIFAHDATTALKYSQFLLLPERVVQKILAFPRINVSDATLFNSCVRWGRAACDRDPDANFQEKLSQLLVNVSFMDLSKKQLTDVIDRNTPSEKHKSDVIIDWLARDSHNGKPRARLTRRHLSCSFWHPELKRPVMFEPCESTSASIPSDRGPYDSLLLLHHRDQRVPFPINSYVLKSRSPVLAARLERPSVWLEDAAAEILSGMEGGCVEVEEDDISPSDMHEFLSYLTTDMADINNDNILALLHLGSKYLVLSLIGICVAYLEDNINRATVFLIMEAACLYGQDTLFEACVRFTSDKSLPKLASLIMDNRRGMSATTVTRFMDSLRKSMPENRFEKLQQLIKAEELGCRSRCEKGGFLFGRMLRQILA